MIVEDLRNREILIKRYPALEKAFDFILQNNGYSHFEEKKYEINDDMFATIGISSPKKTSEQKLEAHRKYVDLQYVIKGNDIIGWKSLRNCEDAYKEYDEEKDIVFFNELPDFDIVLKQGSFALFFPQDAHAPLCGKKSVIKCIVKIKTELFK